jgi:hypothetical protein
MAGRDLQAVAFPTLDSGQVASLERCASVSQKTFRQGEALFRAGDREFKFLLTFVGIVFYPRQRSSRTRRGGPPTGA